MKRRWLAIGAGVGALVMGGLAIMVDDRRSRVVQAAANEAAAYGDAPRVELYWETSGLRAPFPKQWCGAFAEWALRQADLPVHPWVIWNGHEAGFIYPSHLRVTSTPEPGDVMYIDIPWRHHGIVEFVDAEGVHTIEGNTPGITRHVHPLGTPGVVYFSIAPLVEAA